MADINNNHDAKAKPVSATASSTPQICRPAHSVMQLPLDQPLRRQPRAPHRCRDATFLSRYEDRILFYDCFWHEAGSSILLVGPPPFNLEPHHAAASYTAQPSGKVLTATRTVSRSTMLTVLDGAPEDTDQVRIAFAGQNYDLQVQRNFAAELAGAKMLFTMSKNNPLAWIECWARWHVSVHGIDTIVFIDNGSMAPQLDEIEARLRGLPGLKNLVLLDWPYRYGATDKAVLMNRFWAQFLQVSAMNLVLRRFGPRAGAVLNCDVDELLVPPASGSIYDRLDQSGNGMVQLSGTWVEAVIADPAKPAEARNHFDYTHVSRAFTRHISPAKWLLDPTRDWVKNLDTFAYMHDVKFPPPGTKPGRGRFWHFKGINSNWKSQRRTDRRPGAVQHVQPADLAAARTLYQQLLSGDAQ